MSTSTTQGYKKTSVVGLDYIAILWFVSNWWQYFEFLGFLGFFYWGSLLFQLVFQLLIQAAIFLADNKSSAGDTGRMVPSASPDILLYRRAELRRVSMLPSLGTVLPRAFSIVSVAGEFKLKRVIETASKAFWKAVEICFWTSQKGRVGWTEEVQLTKCFSWPSWCWYWCQ